MANTYNDEKGEYTDETLLEGIRNHTTIGCYGNGDLSDIGPSIIDTSGVPDKDEASIQRAMQAAQLLTGLMGISLMQACSIAGVFLKESSCDPTSYNKEEKSGAAASYSKACGPHYGAGINQWSFVDGKNKAVALIGLPAGTPIETLSMEQQCEMYAKGGFGQGFLKQGGASATTMDYAVCCAVIQTHGSGHAQTAFNKVNGNINCDDYVRAVQAEFVPFNGTSKPRQDVPRARKWAEQTYRALGGGGQGVAMSGNLNLAAGVLGANGITMINETRNTRQRSGGIRYIIIHYTAGGSSKPGEWKGTYSTLIKRGYSTDFIVDDGTIVQWAPNIDQYCSTAVGAHNSHGTAAGSGASNRNSVSIETNSNIDRSKYKGGDLIPNRDYWYFSQATLNNLAKLCRYLMQKYKIPKSNVIRHFDITGKECPGIIGWNTGSGNNENTYRAFVNSL